MCIPEIMSKDGKRHFINPEPDATINESRILTEIQWSSNLFSPKHVGMNCMKKNDYTKNRSTFQLGQIKTRRNKL